MGFGSDVGGSVRIPAMFSGIVALKPTAGRLPLRGQTSDGGFTGFTGLYNSPGFMARSAKDIEECAKLMLSGDAASVIKGDCRFVPLPWRDEQAKRDKPLRIGYCDFDGLLEVVPACKRGVKEAVQCLESAGHTLVPYRPSGIPKIIEMCGLLCDADEGRSMKNLLKYEQDLLTVT